MGSKSKNKGKAYEREVAKLLSNVFKENFERVPNSGAFTGGKNASRRERLDTEQEKMFVGDIIPPSSWDIVIECKNHKRSSEEIINILKGSSTLLNNWIKEVRYDANGKFHMLFFKVPYHGSFIALECDQIKYTTFPKSIYRYDLGRGVYVDYIIFHEKHLIENRNLQKIIKKKGKHA